MQKIKLPELGEGIQTATVACVNCQVGDRVEPDQELIEVVTDKATFSITAESEGLIKEIYAQKGQDVPVGSTLVLIEP